MKEIQKNTPAQAARFVPVTGRLPELNSKNRNRLSVFLVQGKTVLSETPVTASGNFQFHVAPHLASEPDVFAVLGPKGLDSQSLVSHTELPRIALSSLKRHEGGISVDFAHLKISDELIDLWWIWCREYTISGTLETGGCPIGALVTVYNVTCGVSGLVKTPLVTVSTDPNGKFMASFNWCSRLCWWPCWPIWWYCWPWWWELDILAAIENIERRLQVQSAGMARVAFSDVAPLRQPSGADLMTGVGFAGSRAGAVLKPDIARTALIASKFADLRIREIFPWWWWCCENPNIVFGATQGANTILDEDPNTSTRWCFPSGQTVPLTGNGVGACQGQTGGTCGFAWTSVGDEPGVLFENISNGYADGTPGDSCSNLAFAGSLNLNGLFGGDCTAFYQVLKGQWGGNGNLLTAGNPARGGTSPVSSQPLALAVQLVDTITVWSAGVASQKEVVLGPCSFNGHDNLYMTRSARPNPPAGVTGLPPFPTISPGDLWGWAAPDLVLTVPAADLVSPAATGGVTLSIVPYDITGKALPTAAQPYEMGPDLTLMIDTTLVTTTTIDWTQSGVYNADNTPATQTTPSEGACPAYQMKAGGGYVLIHTTVKDDAGQLCRYYIQTQYGNGSLPPVVTNPSERNYAQDPAKFTAASTPPPYGVDAGYGMPRNGLWPWPPWLPEQPPPPNWSFVGGGDTIYVQITESCCYDFQLWVSKRTTDGQTFACYLYNPAYQTVNIAVAPSGS